MSIIVGDSDVSLLRSLPESDTYFQTRAVPQPCPCGFLGDQDDWPNAPSDNDPSELPAVDPFAIAQARKTIVFSLGEFVVNRYPDAPISPISLVLKPLAKF